MKNKPRHLFKFVTGILLVATLVCVQTFADDSDEFVGDDLTTLRAVQKQVQQVVRKNLSATVAITDGVGFGSGVVVSKDGLIMTAGHVLTTGGSSFKVIFPNGREVSAKPLGKFLDVDAGMMQLEEEGPFPFVELGDLRELSRGNWCVCLGHSGGYEIGRQPPVRAGRILDFEPDSLVTDCALIGGYSGGPLFDLNGKLIGIHSNIGTSIAMNRHVAVNTYLKYWDRLKSGETWGSLPDLEVIERPRAAMGIKVDLESEDTAIINTVHRGGAGEAAGLQSGDVVIQFDGITVKNSIHLIDLVKQKKPGEQVELLLDRNGESVMANVRLQMLGK